MKKSLVFLVIASSFIFSLTTCNKADTTVQQGQAIFWTMTYVYGNFPGPKTIFVDDKNIGSTSFGYSTAPTCTASGCVIYKANPGTYNWKAVDVRIPSAYETGTFTITSGGCIAVDVTN